LITYFLLVVQLTSPSRDATAPNITTVVTTTAAAAAATTAL